MITMYYIFKTKQFVSDRKILSNIFHVHVMERSDEGVCVCVCVFRAPLGPMDRNCTTAASRIHGSRETA